MGFNSAFKGLTKNVDLFISFGLHILGNLWRTFQWWNYPDMNLVSCSWQEH